MNRNFQTHGNVRGGYLVRIWGLKFRVYGLGFRAYLKVHET